MSIVLRQLDREKFNINITTWLDADDFFKDCQTNFRDIVADTIIEMIFEIVEKDGWNLQYFDENEKEELFISFMKNSKITVRLNKETKQMDYKYKEITVEFNFPENEKKKIAEIYLDNVFNHSYYFEECIIKNLDDVIAKFFSDKVYQLLTVSEIKTKYGDKLEKIINYKA
jgi:hypothetical protein